MTRWLYPGMLRFHSNLLLLMSLCVCSAAEAEDAVGGAAAAGAELFFKPLADAPSNGRACGTCHIAGDALQLTPAHVESRWRALQQRRKHDPNADDVLFRAIDADDHDQDFTLLRQHALVRVVIDLPTDAHGNKLVWPVDDPDATSVELFRAVPTINNVAFTAPYQSDGRFADLNVQAAAAFQAHAEVECEPDVKVLTDIAAFERTQFSSPRAAALAHGAEPEDDTASLSELEQQGKKLFDTRCAACHGGPRFNEQAPFAKAPGARDVMISQPVPEFAAGFGFARSPVADHVRTWAVKVPGQAKPVLRESTDPGIVLQTGNIDNFNEFDIPSLLGVSATAPFFRDNSAATLHEVVLHYQQFFDALRSITPPGDPSRPQPPRIADEDFEPLVAYLETL